jgi:hypothetical protein
LVISHEPLAVSYIPVVESFMRKIMTPDLFDALKKTVITEELAISLMFI